MSRFVTVPMTRGTLSCMGRGGSLSGVPREHASVKTATPARDEQPPERAEETAEDIALGLTTLSSIMATPPPPGDGADPRLTALSANGFGPARALQRSMGNRAFGGLLRSHDASVQRAAQLGVSPVVPPTPSEEPAAAGAPSAPEDAPRTAPAARADSDPAEAAAARANRQDRLAEAMRTGRRGVGLPPRVVDPADRPATPASHAPRGAGTRPAGGPGPRTTRPVLRPRPGRGSPMARGPPGDLEPDSATPQAGPAADGDAHPLELGDAGRSAPPAPADAPARGGRSDWKAHHAPATDRRPRRRRPRRAHRTPVAAEAPAHRSRRGRRRRTQRGPRAGRGDRPRRADRAAHAPGARTPDAGSKGAAPSTGAAGPTGGTGPVSAPATPGRGRSIGADLAARAIHAAVVRAQAVVQGATQQAITTLWTTTRSVATNLIAATQAYAAALRVTGLDEVTRLGETSDAKADEMSKEHRSQGKDLENWEDGASETVKNDHDRAGQQISQAGRAAGERDDRRLAAATDQAQATAERTTAEVASYPDGDDGHAAGAEGSAKATSPVAESQMGEAVGMVAAQAPPVQQHNETTTRNLVSGVEQQHELLQEGVEALGDEGNEVLDTVHASHDAALATATAEMTGMLEVQTEDKASAIEAAGAHAAAMVIAAAVEATIAIQRASAEATSSIADTGNELLQQVSELPVDADRGVEVGAQLAAHIAVAAVTAANRVLAPSLSGVEALGQVQRETLAAFLAIHLQATSELNAGGDASRAIATQLGDDGRASVAAVGPPVIAEGTQVVDKASSAVNEETETAKRGFDAGSQEVERVGADAESAMEEDGQRNASTASSDKAAAGSDAQDHAESEARSGFLSFLMSFFQFLFGWIDRNWLELILMGWQVISQILITVVGTLFGPVGQAVARVLAVVVGAYQGAVSALILAMYDGAAPTEILTQVGIGAATGAISGLAGGLSAGAGSVMKAGATAATRTLVSRGATAAASRAGSTGVRMAMSSGARAVGGAARAGGSAMRAEVAAGGRALAGAARAVGGGTRGVAATGGRAAAQAAPATVASSAGSSAGSRAAAAAPQIAGTAAEFVTSTGVDMGAELAVGAVRNVAEGRPATEGWQTSLAAVGAMNVAGQMVGAVPWTDMASGAGRLVSGTRVVASAPPGRPIPAVVDGNPVVPVTVELPAKPIGSSGAHELSPGTGIDAGDLQPSTSPVAAAAPGKPETAGAATAAVEPGVAGGRGAGAGDGRKPSPDDGTTGGRGPDGPQGSDSVDAAAGPTGGSERPPSGSKDPMGPSKADARTDGPDAPEGADEAGGWAAAAGDVATYMAQATANAGVELGVLIMNNIQAGVDPFEGWEMAIGSAFIGAAPSVGGSVGGRFGARLGLGRRPGVAGGDGPGADPPSGGSSGRWSRGETPSIPGKGPNGTRIGGHRPEPPATGSRPRDGGSPRGDGAPDRPRGTDPADGAVRPGGQGDDRPVTDPARPRPGKGDPRSGSRKRARRERRLERRVAENRRIRERVEREGGEVRYRLSEAARDPEVLTLLQNHPYQSRFPLGQGKGAVVMEWGGREVVPTREMLIEAGVPADHAALKGLPSHPLFARRLPPQRELAGLLSDPRYQRSMTPPLSDDAALLHDYVSGKPVPADAQPRLQREWARLHEQHRPQLVSEAFQGSTFFYGTQGEWDPSRRTPLRQALESLKTDLERSRTVVEVDAALASATDPGERQRIVDGLILYSKTLSPRERRALLNGLERGLGSSKGRSLPNLRPTEARQLRRELRAAGGALSTEEAARFTAWAATFKKGSNVFIMGERMKTFLEQGGYDLQVPHASRNQLMDQAHGAVGNNIHLYRNPAIGAYIQQRVYGEVLGAGAPPYDPSVNPAELYRDKLSTAYRDPTTGEIKFDGKFAEGWQFPAGPDGQRDPRLALFKHPVTGEALTVTQYESYLYREAMKEHGGKLVFDNAEVWNSGSVGTAKPGVYRGDTNKEVESLLPYLAAQPGRSTVRFGENGGTLTFTEKGKAVVPTQELLRERWGFPDGVPLHDEDAARAQIPAVSPFWKLPSSPLNWTKRPPASNAAKLKGDPDFAAASADFSPAARGMLERYVAGETDAQIAAATGRTPEQVASALNAAWRAMHNYKVLKLRTADEMQQDADRQPSA